MHMDVVHDPERVKGYETLLARRHQDVCLRDPSEAKVSLSSNLGQRELGAQSKGHSPEPQ